MKVDLVILATAPGGFRDEGRMHRQFADYREHGEWFTASPVVVSAVQYMAETGELPPADEEDREVAFERRYREGETLQAIANDYGITRERVRQVLRACNVPSLGQRAEHRRAASPISDLEREIAEIYAKGETAPAELYNMFGITVGQLHVILHRTGTKRFGNSHWLTRRDDAERTARVVALYNEGITSGAIAAEIGLPHQTAVYRYLRKAGVKVSRTRANQPLDEEAMLSAYHDGATLNEIADQLNVSQGAVRSRLVDLGALRSRAESEAIRLARVHAANRRRPTPSKAAASRAQVAA